jgi:hypothetical protein
LRLFADAERLPLPELLLLTADLDCLEELLEEPTFEADFVLGTDARETFAGERRAVLVFGLAEGLLTLRLFVTAADLREGLVPFLTTGLFTDLPDLVVVALRETFAAGERRAVLVFGLVEGLVTFLLSATVADLREPPVPRFTADRVAERRVTVAADRLSTPKRILLDDF